MTRLGTGPSEPTSSVAAALAEHVAAAAVVVPVGSRTQWGVGGAAPEGAALDVPAGVIDYEPSDMTVSMYAGTTCVALADVLAAHDQQVLLDPQDPSATVGGVLATGLSGHRRLRHGPTRDTLLEVHVILADGRVVKGGGPTVKNVTGYDVARLIVGSLGTLGVIAQVTLRTWPRPTSARWTVSDDEPTSLLARLHRPASLLWDGRCTFVLLEGHATDLDAEERSCALEAAARPPWPRGAHRGRISVAPPRVPSLTARLRDIDVEWMAELGVGTVHVAAAEEATLGAARAAAHAEDGWLLREAGAPSLDGFGVPLPNHDIMRRLKDALDPTGKMNPGRLPYERSARLAS